MRTFHNSFSLAAAVAAVALFVAAPQAARANLVTNGDFESGTITGWNYNGTVGLNLFVQSQFAKSGNYGAGIGPNGFTGTLSQAFSTAIGETYDLNFWLALVPPAGTGHLPNKFEVVVDGSALLSMVDTATFGFKQYSYSFTATQATTLLEFNVRNDPWGFSLDDVTVARSVLAVSEPGTLALVGLAFAAAGLRRRS